MKDAKLMALCLVGALVLTVGCETMKGIVCRLNVECAKEQGVKDGKEQEKEGFRLVQETDLAEATAATIDDLRKAFQIEQAERKKHGTLQALFAVCDHAAGLFNPPWVAHNSVVARREFESAMMKPGSPWSEHPEDFSLWCVGEFDQVLGVCLQHEKPEKICSAIELRRRPE